MNAAEDRYAGEWEGLLDNLPAFAVEMPDHALADYLNTAIKPQALPAGLTPAQPWDDELLPKELRYFVRDVADRTQCPPDFVAVALIVGISAVVGRKFSIHPVGLHHRQTVSDEVPRDEAGTASAGRAGGKGAGETPGRDDRA